MGDSGLRACLCVLPTPGKREKKTTTLIKSSLPMVRIATCLYIYPVYMFYGILFVSYFLVCSFVYFLFFLFINIFTIIFCCRFPFSL